MNFDKLDILGWILPVSAALLATSAAITSGNDTSYAFAGAVLLLVINERRRAKTITVSHIRVVNKNGAIRGLIGWNGVGIHICVPPSVAFTFGCGESSTSKGPHDHSPFIGLYGLMAKQNRYYSMDFSYDNEADKPDVSIGVNREEEINLEGTNYHGYTRSYSFQLS